MKSRRVDPLKKGSIQECNITDLEYIEYRQTGMITIKEYPISKKSYRVYGSYKKINFYDILDGIKLYHWVEDRSIELSVLKLISISYGIIIIEDFGENYLLEVREPESREEVFNVLKRKGYDVGIVGDNELINIWK